MLLLSMCFFLSAWITPNLTPPWNSFYHDFAAFLGLFFLVLSVLCDNLGPTLKVPFLAAISVLIACVPILQASSGLIYFWGDAWISCAYLFAFSLACTTGYRLTQVQPSDFVNHIAWLFIFGALISALIALYQWLDISGMDLWIIPADITSRPGANLGQPNHLATLLCLGITGIIYLRSTRQISTVLAVLSSLLLVFGIALTQSRMAWASAGFIFIWALVSHQRIPKLPRRSMLTLLAIYIGLITLWPSFTATELTPTVNHRPDISNPGSRPALWSGLFSALKAQPLAGYGWNQVAVAHAKVAKNYPLPEMVSHSHNIFIDLLIWNGIPLGLLIIIFISYWIMTRAWLCRTPESWFGLLAIGLVGIHALFEYPHEYAYFLLPTGLLAGMVDAQLGKPRAVEWRKYTILPISIIYAFGMIMVWLEYRTIETEYRLARFEERMIEPASTLNLPPRLLPLTQLRQDLRFMRYRVTEEANPKELEWMRKVSYRYPHYSSLFRYALALSLNNQNEAAILEIHRLRDLYGEKRYQLTLQNLNTLAEEQHPKLQKLIKQLTGHQS